MEEIKQDNLKFYLSKNLFDEQFTNFIKSLINLPVLSSSINLKFLNF